ncbi:MAG: PqqD family protein, partial [Candidatus Omnitrophica bacterium CG07_land_8_20_14_0_80_50_8]
MGRELITLESFVVHSKEQASGDLGGETAILNTRAGMYYGLDGVGARAWDLIKKPKTVRE